eukprot:scaffold7876_cov67-Phaeocystis_antarctica.AAC.18
MLRRMLETQSLLPFANVAAVMMAQSTGLMGGGTAAGPWSRSQLPLPSHRDSRALPAASPSRRNWPARATTPSPACGEQAAVLRARYPLKVDPRLPWAGLQRGGGDAAGRP